MATEPRPRRQRRNGRASKPARARPPRPREALRAGATDFSEGRTVAKARSGRTPQGPDATLPGYAAAQLFLSLCGEQVAARASRRRKRPAPAATKPASIAVYVTKADLRGMAFE